METVLEELVQLVLWDLMQQRICLLSSFFKTKTDFLEKKNKKTFLYIMACPFKIWLKGFMK